MTRRLAKLGKVVAKLFRREPTIQARRDLRRFKQLMETGEIATSPSIETTCAEPRYNARTHLARQARRPRRHRPRPEIVNPRDAIIKITSTAICGSDLHLYDGYIPGMKRATSSATNSWAKSSRSGRQQRS